MNTRLKYIQNWPELAKEANWSAARLAIKCKISLRTLQRFFGNKFQKTPRQWLAEQRQNKALELLCEGVSVKETAAALGYRHANQFSREFKKFRGYSPASKAVEICTGENVVNCS